MTNTQQPFKVGDKFTIPDKTGWVTPVKRQAALHGWTLTVDGISGREVWSTINGTKVFFFPQEIEKVEPTVKVSTDPLKETVDEVDAKIKRAVEANAKLSAEIQAKNAEATALREQKRKNDDLIIAYGNQITKLKELEKPEVKTLTVGAKVRITSGAYTGSAAELRERVEGGFLVRGNLRNRNNGSIYYADDLFYAPYELELV